MTDTTTTGSAGVDLIAAERARQIDTLGWTPEHDAQHPAGMLACAAAMYALPDHRRPMPRATGVPLLWPWAHDHWKPTPDDRLHELARAGALIAAEMDAEMARQQARTAARAHRAAT